MELNGQAADSGLPLHSYIDYLRYKGWHRPPVLHTRKAAGEVIIGRRNLIWV
jgi:hypothetical protein